MKLTRKSKPEVWPVYLEVGTITRREESDGGSASYTVFVLSCNLCGALVHRADAHNKWHQEMER